MRLFYNSLGEREEMDRKEHRDESLFPLCRGPKKEVSALKCQSVFSCVIHSTLKLCFISQGLLQMWPQEAEGTHC